MNMQNSSSYNAHRQIRNAKTHRSFFGASLIVKKPHLIVTSIPSFGHLQVLTDKAESAAFPALLAASSAALMALIILS